MSNTVILSPHPDDAPLSLGFYIAGLVAAGNSVEVINVFSVGNGASDEYYLRRKEQEIQAAGVLGYTVHFLDLPDAPYRNDNFQNVRQLLFNTKATDEQTTVDELTEKLSHISPESIIFPAGIGGHIDHVICREAARAMGADKAYLEIPYTHVPEWIPEKILSLGFNFNESGFTKNVKKAFSSEEFISGCTESKSGPAFDFKSHQSIKGNAELLALKSKALYCYSSEHKLLLGNLHPAMDELKLFCTLSLEHILFLK